MDGFNPFFIEEAGEEGNMKFRKLEDSPFLKLENIHRFSNKPMVKLDKDSEHTIRIQLYLLEAYSQVPGTFDLKEAVYKALIHDLDEIASCDIPRPFKYYNDEILEVINKVSNELLKKEGMWEELLEDIQKAKDKTVEGYLIKFFDVVDAYRTLRSELFMTGNSSF